MDNGCDERRLEIPNDVVSDSAAIELVTVWFSNSKVKIMTRSGTGLDENSAIWGEVLAGVAANIAKCTKEVRGVNESTTLNVIKKSLDRNWSKFGAAGRGSTLEEE